MTDVRLPRPDGTIETYRPGPPGDFSAPDIAATRVAFAAAHVVADPLADIDPWLGAAIDWDRTLAFREHLWRHGLAVAEAMDTAQRGMGLGWQHARELIRRSAGLARSVPGAVVRSGVGTDHLAPSPDLTPDRIVAAYLEQLEDVEAAGSGVILMASRALAATARGADDYMDVYGRVLAQVSRPAILHWLGDMFDPALQGYWGCRDFEPAMETCLSVIAANAAKIDGIKISLLSKDKEIAMRRRLPDRVRMYTGDDFNYPELIAGDDRGHSDALLGIFDPIAPAAAAALAHLAAGDTARYREILEPTVALSRHVFASPTRFYKTGIVFLAFLNGHQDHFTMIGGQESARSTLHLAALFRLADRAGLLADPERAALRMRQAMVLRGIA